MQYNNPAGGSPSSVGNQLNTQYYEKKALIEARKEQYFTQLADAKTMPKNFGKKIKLYHYLPILDDRNINDQGIDANGATILNSTYYVTLPRRNLLVPNGTQAATATAIQDNMDGVTAAAGADGSGGAGLATITVTGASVGTVPAWVRPDLNPDIVAFRVSALAKATLLESRNIGAESHQGSGNLYGSSKDIGTINGKMPVLSETGGRVNRVGFKRIEVESSLEKFGFFDEYTQETLDFDTDADLAMHVNREMLNAAAELTEDALQIDLLTAAGTVRYTGAAVNRAGINATEVTYGDLMRLSIDLDNARTPKQLTAFTGTRMVDTRTVPGARAMYIGSELLPTIKAMKDLHNNAAFIPVEKYAAGGQTLIGEVGSVDQFRLIVVPEMLKWAGAGADATGNTTHYKTNGRFDVFPMLVIGEGAFTTISFQTDGKSTKFKITHKAPGEATADRNDPYGEMGFMSIKWYYGFMVLRSERLGLLLTAAKL